MYYQKNLKFINARFPFLINELNNVTRDSNLTIEVVQSKTGKPVARVAKGERRVFLNSAYDPELEAERWAEKHVAGEKSTLFIFGGGFLYHLKAILKKRVYQRVVCYEPCPELLKECLSAVDLTDLQEYDFLLVTGSNKIEVASHISCYLMSLILENRIEILPYYQELFGEAIDRLQYVLWETIRINRLNLATSKTSGSRWLINGARNCETIINSPGIRNFFNKFNGVPAVIVSAGPSLAKNIHLLKELKEKALIICAGTSIRAMLKFGVKPHFLVAFDGAVCNREIYGNLDLSDICLIYSYRFYHEALQHFIGKRVYMKLDTDTFSDYLSLKLGGYDFGTIRSGFSVAHSALDLAMKLGCGPVILIGQDLAYTGDQKYAENLMMVTVDRQDLPPGFFLSKDIYGKEIVTDQKLDSMRLLFELMAAEFYQGKTIINATEGGQPIKGVPNRKLAEVINEYCQSEKEIARKIDHIYNMGIQEIKRHASQRMSILEETYSSAIHEFFHMEALINRVDQTRKALFFEGLEPEKIEAVLKKTAAEYETFISKREWQLLLKDVIDGKISPNQIALQLLGEAKSSDTYYNKAQYWLNILAETSLHLRYLIGSFGRLINSINDQEDQVLSITEIANVETWQELQEKIRNSEKLDVISTRLGSIVKQGGRRDINEYQYLYGLVLYKIGQLEKAYGIMNLLVAKDISNAKAHYLTFRIIRRFDSFNITQILLKKCLELNYKIRHCQRRLVLTAYQCQEYLVANNYLTEFEKELRPRSFYLCISVACLASIKLYDEAEKAYQDLINNYRVRPTIRKGLADLLAKREETEFERVYQTNTTFFGDQGVELGGYSQTRYRVCRYLNEEYIFDSKGKRFMPVPEETDNDPLEIVAGETLLICDTDNIKIYEQLRDYLQKELPEAERQKILLTPIFVVERQTDRWQLLMQKFDFSSLKEWRNLHFLIGMDYQDLERFYQDIAVPLPNVLYGTDLAEIKELLEKVKAEREVSYQQSMASLKEYYQRRGTGEVRRVLVVTSIADQALFRYGRALTEYLTGQGYQCRLEHENPPYYKFSKYTDIKLLDGFKPDLVVQLFALQEELEAYRDLKIPYLYWRILDRPLDRKIIAKCSLERVLVHGDQKFGKELLNKGFRPEQVREVRLPYLLKMAESHIDKENGSQVAIIADIKDPEPIINNMVTVVFGMFSGGNVAKQDVVSAINSIYFRLYAHLLNQDSVLHEDNLYNEIVNEELIKYRLDFGKQMADFIASLFRREMEDTILTMTQVSWIINSNPSYTLRLFGKGWGKDPSFKKYYRGCLIPLSDKYQATVLGSKINLYTSRLIQNNTYMQPDLINGIAMGGFFLVNGSLVRTVGERVLEPFDGLLEVYQNRAELLDKVKFYLSHEAERIEKAERLQDHVLKNFGIELVAKEILDAYREIG